MLRALRRKIFLGSHIAVLALAASFLVAPNSALAQRGSAMGHSGGGHFAPAMRGGAPAPAMRGSRHLTYLPPARRSGIAFPRRGNFRPPNPSRAFFISDRRFHRNNFRFASRFGVPFGGFFPFGVGYGLGYGWGYGWDDGWDWSPGYNTAAQNRGCDPADPNCDRQESSYSDSFDSGTSAQRPMIVVYLRDGTGYGALDYWATQGILHIATTYGAQKSFPLEEVDLDRTGKENAQHGVNFTFYSYPMASDPGTVLAPDSYAPPCGAAATPARDLVSPDAKDANSSFGVSGAAVAKGLVVTAVRENSPATQVGLQTGDVIVRVDCRAIRNAQDVESAFAASGHTMWVSYLIQGSWLTDKKVSR